jgi:erythromycin esterase-like protein
VGKINLTRFLWLFGVPCLGMALTGVVSAQLVESRAQAAASVAPMSSAVPGTPASIRRVARPIRGSMDDYDALMQRVGDSRVVLLGEDTHGSLEFYRERIRITQRLIEEKGFNGLVIESDWAASSRVDRYVRGEAGDNSAEDALSGHTRFPDWMWRNVPFRGLVEWLRDYNRTAAGRLRPVGVYGMDSQGMESSAAAVLASLARVDPAEAARARERYACLERFEFNGDRYGTALRNADASSCEAGAAGVFDALRERFAAAAESRTAADDAEWFSALQNARVVRTAEAYARALVTPGTIAWNVRDRHMTDVVDAVLERLERRDGTPAKLVVWAHNTHVGDARATDRGTRSGYWSLGQLVRERHAGETVVVGFTTRLGTVRAAPSWGEADRVYNLRRPAWESVPAIFGRTRLQRFMLVFAEAGTQLSALDDNVPLRAIGVVYWPKFERSEHYYRGRLTQQFDAVVHIDRTQALPRLSGN